MFHMHDDVKILTVSAAAALSALIGAFLVARWIVSPIERYASHLRLAAGDLSARARPRPAHELRSSRPPSTRWRRTSKRSSTHDGNSSPGRVTIFARLSLRFRR